MKFNVRVTLAFVAMCVVALATVYASMPPDFNNMQVVLALVMCIAMLWAQTVLLTGWVSFGQDSKLLRCAVLFFAPALPALVQFIMAPSDPAMLVRAYGYALFSVALLMASFLILRWKGLRLESRPDDCAPTHFSLRRLFALLTGAALLMIVARWLRSQQPAPTLNWWFHEVLTLAVNLAIFGLVLRRGRAGYRFAGAALLAIGAAMLEGSVFLNRVAHVLFSSVNAMPFLFTLGTLVLVRRAGYRLDWFEPGPRERLAAVRRQREALLGEYAAQRATQPEQS